jgi:hypothetical protein
VLGVSEWNGLLRNLPGYAPASAPGKVLVMTAALPWWRYVRAKVRGADSPVQRELAKTSGPRA